LFTRGPEVHWWLTGFKWGVLSDPSQLSVDVAITLKDTAMRDAFIAGIAGRLTVARLGLLHLADYLGLAASQLAVGIGKDIPSIVTAFSDRFGVAAGTVEGWLNGVSQEFSTWVSEVEKYLGLPLDFSCYVMTTTPMARRTCC